MKASAVRVFVILAVLAAQVLVAGTARSEEDDDSPPPTQTKTKRSSKGKRARGEKETEGTQAPNRFEADTVIQSEYHVDGRPLEVDPD